MSAEQVLLFVALVALPLAQYLFRILRQRHGTGEAPEQGRPPVPESEVSPATTYRAILDALLAPERAPEAYGPAALPVRRNARPGAVPALRDPAGLRRAILLMTVLQPCRAMDPHD